MKRILSLLAGTLLCFAAYSQEQNGHYSLAEVKAKLTEGMYSDKVLKDFHHGLNQIDPFPRIHEYIPGEVIAWSWVSGRLANQQLFLVKKDSLFEVKAIPSDEAFIEELNSYVPEKSAFKYMSDLWSFPFVKEKIKRKYFLIKATVTSYNPYPDYPNDDILSYDIEYRTKDFQNFSLLRLKDTKAKEWMEVK